MIPDKNISFLRITPNKPFTRIFIFKILVCSICNVFYGTPLFPQISEWQVYSNGNKVNCQVIHGNFNWVGTNGGIVKINITTAEIEYFNTGNSGLQMNYVQCLEADINGNIWVGNIGSTFCGGLSSFSQQDWTYYDPPPNYKKYNSITADDKGNVWVSTDLSGLFRFSNNNWEVFNMNNTPFPTNSIGNVVVENDSTVWVIVFGQLYTQGCLAKLVGNNWELVTTSNSNIPSNDISAIDIDKLGNKWIGTSEGLTMFDGNNWIVYNTQNSEIPDNMVTSVVCDENNNVWVGTYNSGLGYYDGNSWITYLNTNSILPNNKIRSIAIDKDNTVWIINELDYNQTGRVISFDGEQWVQYETNSSPMPNNTPTCLALDTDSSVWLGTNDGFANIKDNVWTLFSTQNTPIENDDIRAIACEKNGTKWFGSLFYGLIKYYNEEWTVYTLNNSPLTSRQIECITIDEYENKWIGMSSGGIDSGGLLKISHDNNWTIYNSNNSDLPYDKVSCISIDKTGVIWVGTWNGLAKIENGIWTVFNTINSGLPDDWICSLAVDSSNTLWIGTRYAGLVKYNSQGWSVYNTENSEIPDNCVFAITVDAMNNLWIGTMYGGLTKLAETDWLSFNCSNSGMPGSNTTNIIIDHNNTKWVTSTSINTGGLALYNENGLSGIKEIKNPETSRISLFPNPVHNFLDVKIYTECSHLNLTLMNIAGQVIRVISLERNQKTIDVSGLATGIYIISVSCIKETIGTTKFFKL